MGKRRVKLNNQVNSKRENKNEKGKLFLNCDSKNKAGNFTVLFKTGLSLTRPNGLNNLGNTCYFNAIIQILVHSPLLYEMLNKKSNENIAWKAYKQVDISNKSKFLLYSSQEHNKDLNNFDDNDPFLLTFLSSPNSLTKAFVNLLREMRTKSCSSINPSRLLEEIAKKNSNFKGRSQQDSHELLRCLLDCIKADEVRRHRKAILSALNIKAVPNIKYDSETKALAKSFSIASNFTSIDSLLGGYLLSSVRCEECESTSMIFEPFFDLSLSLYNEKQKFASSICKKENERKNANEDLSGSNCFNTKGLKNRKNTSKRQERRIEKRKLNKKKYIKKDSILTQNLKQEKNKTRNRSKTNGNNNSDLDDNFYFEDKTSNFIDVADNLSKPNVEVEQIKKNLDDKISHNKSFLQVFDLDLKSKSSFNETAIDQRENSLEISNNATDICQSNLTENNLMKKKNCNNDSIVNDVSSLNTKNLTSNNATNSNHITKIFTQPLTDLSANPCLIKDTLEKKFDPLSEDKSELKINPVEDFDLFENTYLNQEKIRADLFLEELKNLHLNGKFDCDTNKCYLNIENSTIDNEIYESSKEDESDEQISNEADNEEEYENELCSKFNGFTYSSDEENLDIYKTDKECKNRIRTSSFAGTEEEIKAKNQWVLTPLSLFSSFEPSSANIYSCLSSFTSAELLAGTNKIICENCSQRYKKKFNIEKKIYANASKRMLIAFPPPILTLHLKRFEVDSKHYVSLKKINQFISFPLKLNLSPFVSRIYLPLAKLFENHDSDNLHNSIIYDLYGVVEHSGSIRSGHYTVFIKLRKEKTNLKKFTRMSPFIANVEEIVESIDYNNLKEIDEKINLDLLEEEGVWFYISDSHVSLSNASTVLSSQAYLLFYERIK